MASLGTYMTCPHHGPHTLHVQTAYGPSCVRCINERKAARKAAHGVQAAPKEQRA